MHKFCAAGGVGGVDEDMYVCGEVKRRVEKKRDRKLTSELIWKCVYVCV